MRFLGRVHLEGKEYLDAENLFVPLADDNDEPTFIMGLCRYTPRRTEADESWENQIASIPAALPLTGTLLFLISPPCHKPPERFLGVIHGWLAAP